MQMSIDKEIVEDFVSESKTLIEELIELLENIEGDPTQVKKLADYGNNVDRIMGGAKSLALMAPPDHALHMISDYSALCKAVGYKASQLKNNESFYNTCVAILLDATETLETLLERIHTPSATLKETIPQAFIDRLRWVSNQFSAEFRESVDSTGTVNDGKLAQTEIDDLLKKLGL